MSAFVSSCGRSPDTNQGYRSESRRSWPANCEHFERDKKSGKHHDVKGVQRCPRLLWNPVEDVLDLEVKDHEADDFLQNIPAEVMTELAEWTSSQLYKRLHAEDERESPLDGQERGRRRRCPRQRCLFKVLRSCKGKNRNRIA